MTFTVTQITSSNKLSKITSLKQLEFIKNRIIRQIEIVGFDICQLFIIFDRLSLLITRLFVDVFKVRKVKKIF
jgi:hypothetical protein